MTESSLYAMCSLILRVQRSAEESDDGPLQDNDT